MFTDNPMLTRHLLNADFFEANTYPKATFKTTSIEAQAEGENTHSVTGDLTMHGVTKSISFPAKVSVSGGKAGLESKFTIDRREFGITYGQGMVNNDVEITVRVNAG
jgi:polyisoprenoid-binding protein YceI